YIESVEPVPVFPKVFCQNGTKLMRLEKLEAHLGENSARGADEDFTRRVEEIKIYADLISNSPAS
ncbi:hypothetical protein ACIPUD_39295, partial [Bradyrhizobium sp. CAR08]